MKEPQIIIASGPVIVENNRVLLNQHGDTNFWKFCGGKVEDYTTNLIENATREAREEMGIGLEIIDKNPFLTFTRKKTSEKEIDIILAHFSAKRVGEIYPGEDIREWNWFSLNNLPQNLAPNILPVLRHFGFLK